MAAIHERIGYRERIGLVKNLVLPIHKASDEVVTLPNMDKSVCAVLQNIRTIGRKVLVSNDHALFSLPNPLSHQPNGSSKTLWITEIDGNGNPVDWKPDAWKRIARDGDFCAKLDMHIFHSISHGENSYLYFGFKKNNKNYMYPTGPQTLFPPHFHEVKSYSELPPERLLRLEDSRTPADFQRFVSLSNIAGEAAIEYWKEVMNDFANSKFILNQRFESITGSSLEYPRSFFGFLSIEDALRQMLYLEKQLGAKWDKFCKKIYSNSPVYNDEKIGKVSFFKQRPIVSAVFMFPSLKDKIIKGRNNDHSIVWVAPFAVSTAPQLLKGVDINRSK